MRVIPEETVTVTVRLPASLNEHLEDLARATNRPLSFLMAEAIRTYLEIESEQFAEINKAVVRSDLGDFASDDCVAAVRRKFTTPHTKVSIVM